MKKRFVILLLFVLITINSNAQSYSVQKNSKDTKHHVFKTNMLGLFTLFYEHPLSYKTSFQVGLQYNPENLPEKHKLITSIAPEIKYYIISGKIAPSGLFTGIYAKYQSVNEIKIDKKADIKILTGGLNLGYQYIFKSGFVTEFFIGGGYNFIKNINTDFPKDFPEKDYQFDVRLGISAGYSF